MVQQSGTGRATPATLARLSGELVVVLDPGARVVGLEGSRRPELLAIRELITSRPWREIVHPEDAAAVAAGLRHLRAGGRIDALAFRIRLPDGSDRWLEGRGCGEQDGRSVVVLRDATGQRRRFEIEDRLARLAGVGTWEVDVPSGVARWSPHLRRLFGLGAEEAPLDIPDTLACYLTPRRSLLADAMERLLSEGRPFDLELALRPLHGPDRWVRCTGEAVLDDGRPTTIIGTVQDLTVSHREQLRLARIEQLARLTDSGLLELDGDQRVLFANARASELLGVGTGARLLGRRLLDLLPSGTDRAGWARLLEHDGTPPARQRLPIGTDRVVQAVVRQLDPKRRDGAADAPDEVLLQTPSEPTLLVALNDITGLVDAERARDAFLATVSHELRSPLAAVAGSIASLQRGVAGPLPEAAELLLEVADRSAGRLQHLVDDLLDSQRVLAGRVRLELDVHDLVALVTEVVDELQYLAHRSDRSLEVVGADMPAMVRADAVRVQQVLTNLVSNALRYSPAGTPVAIELDSDGDTYRVAVRDHGPGVPESFAGRIFERFSQADPDDPRSAGGTGLGLAISRELVERMGGTIGFESEPGRTVFWFELPAAGAGEADTLREEGERG